MKNIEMQNFVKIPVITRKDKDCREGQIKYGVVFNDRPLQPLLEYDLGSNKSFAGRKPHYYFEDKSNGAKKRLYPVLMRKVSENQISGLDIKLNRYTITLLLV
jgi:hypothetical protein